MPEPTEIQHDLKVLEAELKKLEAEYNMFFAGRLARPPWETRGRVERIIKSWDRAHIQAATDRFRFNTLRTRFATLADLWDRALRAKEEGRPGPFALTAAAEAKKTGKGEGPKIVHAVAMSDPMKEMDKVHALYDSLMEARKKGGGEVVPFHKFAALVKDQVTKIREHGSPEVAFRVAIKDGKVKFTARGVKGPK